MHTCTLTVMYTTRFEVTAQISWSSDCDVYAIVPGMSGIVCIAVLQLLRS